MDKRNTDYDVFVSHASEDKLAVARPLATALAAEALNVWYDDFSLAPGDSLSGSIDTGLSRSRWGLVIVSPSFLAKEWPMRELHGIVALTEGGEKGLLPVWHGITKAEVARVSPTLADVKAVLLVKGLDQAVLEILSAIDRPRNSADPMAPAIRHFESGQFRAAIQESARVLEGQIRRVLTDRLSYAYFRRLPLRNYTLGKLFRLASEKKLLFNDNGTLRVDTYRIARLRNDAIHSERLIAQEKAEWFFQEVRRFQRINKRHFESVG